MIYKYIIALACFMGFGIQNINAQDEALLGEIRIFAGDFAPQGWQFCDGQTLQIVQYTALFSILGTTYGGDGITTFKLPDLRGRMAIAAGQGNGLTNRPQGEMGGSENNVLSVQNLPLNQPGISSTPADAGSNFTSGNNAAISVGNPSNTTISTAAAGSGQPVNNMQPYLTIRYIICTEGIFPSRQ